MKLANDQQQGLKKYLATIKSKGVNFKKAQLYLDVYDIVLFQIQND